MQRKRFNVVIITNITLSLLPILMTTPATAQIQRWVDKHGIVHYGDHIPAEYLGQGSIQLNNQGVRVKEKSAAPTDAERQKETQLEIEQKELERQRKEQLRRDRSLMDTYANIDEIKRVRDRELESIDNAINVIQVRLTDISTKKVALDEQLQQKLPPERFSKLAAERDAYANEISHLNDILFKRQTERKQTMERFGNDIKRYQQITNAIATQKNLSPRNPLPITP